MANTLKIKRGAAASIPQGQLAEPLFTSDTYDLYIGKGGALGNQRFQKYIASGTSSQFLKGDGSLDSNTYQTALTFSSPLVNTSGTISIPAATSSVNGYLTSTDWTTFNSKEPAITAGTTLQYYRGDKTFQTLDTSVVPENGPIYFTEPRVRATVLTGLNLSGGGTIAATDSVLTAFGKVQNQISALVGGATYQGTWNASTNSPTLASGTGTKGYYYVVSVAGSTNLDGITDWKIGDWAIFNGTTWDKVDNTDAVSSVNGFTGAVNLALDNISDVSAASPTNAQLLRFNGTSSLWENWTPTFEPALTKGNLTEATSSVLTITGGTGAVIGSGTTIAVASAGAAQNGVVTTGTQTFAGAKTFNSSVTASALYVNGMTAGSGAIYHTGSRLTFANYNASGTLNFEVNGGASAMTINADKTIQMDYYTTNGFVKFSSSNGTLTVDTNTYLTTSSASSTYLPLAGGTLTGALSGTSATFNVGSATTVLGLTGNGNGATIASITNTDTGSSARSSFQVTSDSATAHYFASSSTNVSSATGGRASTAGIFTASGDTAGGLAFLARNAAGVITFHTGGNTERVRIAANGETTFNNNVTLANGSDLVITPATSGVNATLYNDIGKLVSTASLVVQGTGEFTGALSGTSATFSSLSQNYIIKGGASGLLTSSGIIKEDGTKVEFLYSVSNSNQGVNLVNSNGSGYGNSINFYQSTTQTAQIFCESSVANTSEILFKTLVGGVLGTRFTIASTGAATFSSSVTLTSGQVRIEGSTAQAIYLYGAAGTKPYITLNEFGVRDWAISAGQSASGTLSITKTVGGTDGIIISGTGNVGIGTSSPNITGFTGTVLTINGTGNYQGLEIGTSGTARMTIVSDGTNGYVSTRQANMSLIFETGAASEKMRITSGGKVNINDTSNTTKQFSVINSSNSNSVAFFNNTVTNGRVLELRRKSGDTGDYFIVADNVTDNKFLVNGAGTIYAVNTTVQSVSDIAFKENIRDLELGLKHILDLKPRRFDWKEGKGLNEKNTIGFIAQEVEKSIPDIVKNDWKINMQDDKVYKSLGMTNMIPVLVKAIQELKAELDTLKNK